MKIVVQTQFSENYAAHDWDGAGECPQRWKQKGGSTFIVTGVTVEKAADESFWASIDAAVEHDSDFSSERVIGTQLIDDIDFNVRDHLPAWETPIYLDSDLDPEEPGFTALQTTENDEYQTMRPEIRRMFKRWTQVDGDVKDADCSFEFIDGNVVPYSESQTYLESLT